MRRVSLTCSSRDTYEAELSENRSNFVQEMRGKALLRGDWEDEGVKDEERMQMFSHSVMPVHAPSSGIHSSSNTLLNVLLLLLMSRSEAITELRKFQRPFAIYFFTVTFNYDKCSQFLPKVTGRVDSCFPFFLILLLFPWESLLFSSRDSCFDSKTNYITRFNAWQGIRI